MNYKQVDDLAVVWCEYGEMELRHENYEQALRILRVMHLFYIYIVLAIVCTIVMYCIVTEKGTLQLLEFLFENMTGLL